MVEKNRAKTFIERHGFKDKELSTPAHDAIMEWLDENIVDVAGPIILDSVRARVDNELARLNENNLTASNQPYAPKILKAWTVWEPPVCAPNKFLVGFIDMEATFLVDCPYLDHIKKSGTPYASRDPQDYDREWIPSKVEKVLLFEVKTTIESKGELFRQLNMYQQYRPGTYVVVSPDDRSRNSIERQGFRFIKVPSGVI
jgi:hypothetical protein